MTTKLVLAKQILGYVCSMVAA